MDYRRTPLLRYFKFFVGLSIFLELLSAQGGYRVIGQYCEKYQSYTKSTFVSYVESYKVRNWAGFWKIVTRINYRWEYNPALRTVKECCDGYRSLWSECIPVCPSGCNNGNCYQPNVCQCFPGYAPIVNTDSAWMECVPHCPDGCNGGECTAPSTCTCKAGYRFSEDHKRCVPSCLSSGAGGSEGCGENASCIAPDTCQCHDGYAKNPKDSQPLCLPICTPACGANAFCDSPDKCICNAGYVIDRNPFLTFPSPPNNHNSMTTDPVFTTFGTTPYLSSTHCKPSCTPDCAKNSTCVAPDKCQCDPGYRSESSSSDAGDLLRCDPICERTCVNAFCGYPNKCVCHLGYRPHPVEESVCVPVCRDGCVNGRCVQPDHCECNNGYVKKDDEDGHHQTNLTHICIPHCPGGCPNGKCVAPGQCACDPGYVLTNQETTLDLSTTTEFGTTSSVLNDDYNTDTTDYSSTDSTDYYTTDNAGYYSTDSTNYYGTSDTSSNTIAPMYQQICQPLCEPECPRGSICIAPPDHCQSQSGISEDSDDAVTDRRPMKNDTNICNGNGTDNGSSCDAVESAIISHTAASAIGTLVLLAAIFGLGAIVYLIIRKRKNVTTQAFAPNSIGTMDPLISTDVGTDL